MTIDDKDLLNSILASLNRIDHIKPEAIPDIDLYMDQVTTFMDNNLAPAKRNPDDKILTKTMINNYTKDGLLPPPEKKKYSKEHMLLLIFIYYFKNILSINDLHHILDPLVEKYFFSKNDLNLTNIYNEVFSLEKEEVQYLTKDITKKFNRCAETFQNASDEERESLQLFSLICMLSFDTYLKKLIIEKMIDLDREKHPLKNVHGKKTARRNKADKSASTS